MRRALLAAAREQFSERAFKAVSVREIARAAGVNPAMINYYFGDKRGLYEAMIEESVGPLLSSLVESEAKGETVRPDEMFARHVRTLASNPWLPNLIVREVLYGETEFRHSFVEKYSGRLAAGLVEAMRAQRAAGGLPEDVEPEFATLALISLAVFPFLARPVVERSLGLEIDEVFAERWAQQAMQLLTRT